MEALGVVANVIAVVDLSAKIAERCYQYSKDVLNAKDDIARIKREVDSLLGAAKSVKELLSGPDGERLKASSQLSEAARESEALLRGLDDKLRPKPARKAMRRLGVRALKWPFESKEAQKIIQDLMRCTQRTTLALQVDQTALLLDVDQKMVLARLENHVAMGAAFDSREEEHNSKCLLNTRVELLQRISEWADSSSSETVFWLNGMAGTGKSTISRTVALSLAKDNRLGASFFFKSGEADRGNMAKFFSTIAADLVRGDPAIARHVKGVIEREPAIFRKAMREQFDNLFLEPLSITRRKQSLVVVVDALDECEQENDVKLMIHLFSQASSLQSVQVKVFLTSRPDLPIRLGFKAVEGKYQDLTLHEIPSTVVEHDIYVFLQHELASIRGEFNTSVQEYRRLAADWPGQSNIQSLVQMTTPLFIFAATVCRFVNDRRCGNPNEQLDEVLLFRTKSQASQLDATYMPVLNKLIDGVTTKQRDQILQHFRDIIGSIIILAKPLSTVALGQILRIPVSTIDDRLDLLHSVLSIPSFSGAPVRLLHLSFRDFLLDPGKREKSPFWVDEKLAHDAMAANCLRVMDCLKQDICQVEAPGTDRSDIDPLTVDRYLPSEVQYACLYWVYHIQGANNHESDCERVYAFLEQHFTHWLESLSLLGKAWESVHLVKDLQTLYKNHGHKQLSEFLDDAERFILENTAIIDSNPLQIYSSLLMFTPRNRQIYTTFKGEIPPWISLLSQVETEWDSCLLTLQGHRDRINSVAFSHDSALVVSASRDKYIRIWRADTGECIQTSKCHELGIISVTFLRDSAVVRYICDDYTVHSWRLDTGDYSLIYKSPCHGQSVRRLAFSHDSALVALNYYHEAILIWSADAGEVIQMLECPGVSVTSAAFSHDSALLASTCSDRTMRIWRTDTGECMHRLETLAATRLESFTFSYDSTLVASSFSDRTFRIWRADTGECVQTISSDTLRPTELVFSNDGALISSNSDNDALLIWQIDTGECIEVLRGHTGPVTSVTTSRDSKLVATGAYDCTIRIWRVDTDSQAVDCDNDAISRVAFTYDSALVASTSKEKATRVWRADTGEHIRTLEGNFCGFSPDSTLVATDLGHTGIGIWRIDTGERVQMLAGIYSAADKIAAFSPDSALVAAAPWASGCRTEIWRVATGERVRTLKQRGFGWVRSAAFSKDSALLALGCDGEIGIVHVETGEDEVVQLLGGMPGAAVSIAFSHDSAIIASSFSDETIRIWRVNTGRCVQIINIGFTSHRLLFEAGTARLQTDHGDFAIQAAGPECPAVEPLAEAMPAHALRPLRKAELGCWITWNGHKLVSVPIRIGICISAASRTTLAMGCRSGRVMIIKISPEHVPKGLACSDGFELLKLSVRNDVEEMRFTWRVH